MDITESFRNEDITKTDFFDLVITPDLNDSHFAKHIRNVNTYLTVGPDVLIKQELNNNDANDHDTSTNLITDENCGTLDTATVTTTTSANLNSYEPPFWSCDKDTIKIEPSLLDDLNKYYWQQDSSENHNSGDNKQNFSNTGGNNASSDGHIYTLTVLNGIDQSSWYRQTVPTTSTMLIKQEDITLSNSVANTIDQIQSSLDIESILSIMPTAHMNGYSSSGHDNSAGHQESFLNDTNNNSPNTDDGIIKTETFTYDDSGYADNKDELATSLIIDTPLLEAHDNFNQSSISWKNGSCSSPGTNEAQVQQARTQNHRHISSPDSLLRNALQGKSYVRYNGSPKISQQYQKVPANNHTELRRALSNQTTLAAEQLTGAVVTSGSANGTIFLQSATNKENVIKIDANRLMFDDGVNKRIGAGQMVLAGTAGHSNSVDDILFQQLDRASYPEDYEKLKKIANEVAQSVQNYCLIDNGTGISSGDLTILTTSTLITSSTPGVPAASTAVLPKASSNRKKKANSSSSSSSSSSSNSSNQAANLLKQNVSSAAIGGLNGANSNSASSNSIRKERSLHYCGICSKGFKDKYSVNVHIRTHTGEKPFACNLCGKSFRQKAHLAKHYQTHIAQKNATGTNSSPKTIKSANR